MFLLPVILADGVTLKLGDQVWSFGLNFIVYLIVAAIVGFVAESLVGWRLPLGFVDAIIAALLGAWLLTKVLVAVWHLLTYHAWRGRRRSSYSRG